ncbi:MAG: [Fe-Fe] hydrogenase large subunit C-terminal domain-containing protein [bacterium]
MPLNPELQILVDILSHEKVVCLLAPSFPVDFSYPEIILDLKKIGVDKIVELTYAAKLINIEYEKILKENPDKRYICPNCPTVVKMIEIKYPELKEYIIDVASPMVIMNRFVKKAYGPEYKTLFIGPCFAKKMEAKTYGIDYAITFKELQDIFNYIKENTIAPKEFTYSVTED